MIAVGEESGRLEDLCLRVADTYDGEVRRSLRTGVALLEPALILIFGALVGFVALGCSRRSTASTSKCLRDLAPATPAA